MSLLQAVFLGIVQGLSEFLPVSSSGHLVLAGDLLGVHQSLAFDVALHLGTLIAVLVVFGRDYVDLVRNRSKLIWILAISTLPAVAAGLLLGDLAETVFRQNWLVAFNLIAVAVLMLAAERVGKSKRADVSYGDGAAIGFAQALAIIPGISRSGITITTGLLAGLTREKAMRFSFLLSGPVIAGAALKIFTDPAAISEVSANRAVFAAGVISAAVSGYLAIRFMLSYLAKHRLDVFAYYRIALGVLVLVWGAS